MMNTYTKIGILAVLLVLMFSLASAAVFIKQNPAKKSVSEKNAVCNGLMCILNNPKIGGQGGALTTDDLKLFATNDLISKNAKNDFCVAWAKEKNDVCVAWAKNDLIVRNAKNDVVCDRAAPECNYPDCLTNGGMEGPLTEDIEFWMSAPKAKIKRDVSIGWNTPKKLKRDSEMFWNNPKLKRGAETWYNTPKVKRDFETFMNNPKVKNNGESGYIAPKTKQILVTKITKEPLTRDGEYGHIAPKTKVNKLTKGFIAPREARKHIEPTKPKTKGFIHIEPFIHTAPADCDPTESLMIGI